MVHLKSLKTLVCFARRKVDSLIHLTVISEKDQLTNHGSDSRSVNSARINPSTQLVLSEGNTRFSNFATDVN